MLIKLVSINAFFPVLAFRRVAGDVSHSSLYTFTCIVSVKHMYKTNDNDNPLNILQDLQYMTNHRHKNSRYNKTQPSMLCQTEMLQE